MHYPIDSCDFCAVIYSYANINMPQLKLSITYNYSGTHNLLKILDFESQTSHWTSNNDPSFQQHFTVEFENRLLFRITNYTIISYPSVVFCMPAWNFYGSRDGIYWSTIHSVGSSTDLECSSTRIFSVNEDNHLFSFFRIQMTNKSQNDYHMRIANFDIFGYLLYHSNSNYCSNFHYSILSFQRIFFQFL